MYVPFIEMMHVNRASCKSAKINNMKYSNIHPLSVESRMATSSKAQMKVANYTIDFSDHIGSGAMGVVHPATNAVGKKVAAKRICGKADSSMAKISKDLHKLMTLDHPNIVKFYNISQQKSDIWIFMEYCIHKDLNEVFHKRKLNKHEKIDIMVQISQGVEYLHGNKIIHRDIKPSNILISSDNPFLAKLTDFDFSKIFEENYGTSLMSTNVGTERFKAPEFYQRNEEMKIHYRKNVDIYALGLTYLAMIQENKGLVPRIETPNDDSELHAPIGRIIAERIRYNKKPLDVIPEDKKGSLLTAWFSKLTVGTSMSAAKDSVGTAPVALMRKLIRKMTHHVPQNRPSAAEVVQDLRKIQFQVSFRS